ncbi:MAG: RNA pseudouridine synthase [Flavobacteriia bacterium]|nr:RNA pseudouridine synthase [Flavobacteriia bacterium]OJX39112.1 MAG: hypothetical protein BGO87_03770 [Flavobacteriia bacterium 40-80]
MFSVENQFHKLENVKGELPDKFTFPFYYQPHELIQKAAKEVQDYLQHNFDLPHNFGLGNHPELMVIGKMFGVLLVRKSNEIGYLAGFSGKLAGVNHVRGFVPPVFDMLKEDGFFLKGEQEINELNAEIERLESDFQLVELKNDLQKVIDESRQKLADLKEFHKNNKKERDKNREISILKSDFAKIEILNKQSSLDKIQLQQLKKSLLNKQELIKSEIELIENKILKLKNLRNLKSNQLQQQLFDEYNFLNQSGELKNVRDLFAETVQKVPPAAAGDCALPKLLQFAFKNGYEPLAFGEFWWGKPPKSEIRKHLDFYPACTGKCKPILDFMLQGIALEENPLKKENQLVDEPVILFQDEAIVVASKPANLCAVPGNNQEVSLLSLLEETIKQKLLVVHRLDMPTSGIMVFAKTKEAQANLQQQFVKKRVSKRYTAVLNGILEVDKGTVELPLSADEWNPPFQKVNEVNGKPSLTYFEVIERKAGLTKVNFYPKTGRTHQLRVHAAHISGLNAPIVGDDMYGTPAERLFLHAEELTFYHPVSRQLLTFYDKAGF